MEEKVLDGLKYLFSYPKGFREEKKYPLIIFLHGAGTRSETTEKLRANSCLNHILSRQDERGYLFLAPLCPRGTWNEWMTLLVRLIKEVREYAWVDEKRVYLTGNSMGGYGTWEFSSLYADYVAAAMPVCGGGIPAFAKRMVDVPVRAFHGLCDKTVDPIESLEMVKALNQAGGHGELILFPSLKHNCWDAAYSDDKNYDWLLSFTTERDKTLVEQYSGAYYG
ncbi:MAG: dienelactone hydrolase family protein [Clostridia bacterium]|nr:dienelactone hydrolase family protein [Clostridia bacterium]